MATKLILIRHGQTEWNLKKFYCGSTDLGLNHKGRQQVGRLAKRLKRELIHKVYASDRKRAIETAEIAFNGFRIEKVPDLREIHFGVFGGLNYKQIKKKYPAVYEKWLENPYSVTIPNGERLRDFKRRITGALRKIIAGNRNKSVAVVCHGGVISVFLNHILKERNFWKHIPGSASMSVVEFRNGKGRVKLFNDITHLTKGANG